MARKMQKSDFFCIFLSGRAASFPSQAPLETKKDGHPPNPRLYTLHSTLAAPLPPIAHSQSPKPALLPNQYINPNAHSGTILA